MPKRNDGNEEDLRVRPGGKSLDGDNPFTGDSPEGSDPCEDGHGDQTDLPRTVDECGDPIVTEGGTPDGGLKFDWQDISDICPQGLSPLNVDRVFIRILKNHFSDPDKIIDPNLKDFVYNDNPDETNIRIVMDTTFDRASVQTPALVVKRGRQKMQRVVIDDLGETGDVLVGLPHYLRFIPGSHRVLCIGSTDGSTEALAFEVFTILNCLSPNVRRALPFHDFQVSGMSELGLLDDLANNLAVAIESVYSYEYGWTLQEVAPTLKRVLADTTVELEQVSLE